MPQASLSPALITAPEIENVTFPGLLERVPVWKHRGGIAWRPGKGTGMSCWLE